MSICICCLLELFWKDIDEQILTFEDLGKTIFHNCTKLKKNKSITNNDYLLLTQIISRVSIQGQMHIELKKILNS